MIVVEEKILIDAKPKEIYDIITNNEFYLWRSDLSKIEIVDENHFIEYTNKNFPTFFTVIKSIKNKRYETEMINNNIEGKFIIELKKIDNKTEFIIREEIQKLNIKLKFASKLFLKKMQKKYIFDLLKELESKRYYE